MQGQRGQQTPLSENFKVRGDLIFALAALPSPQHRQQAALWTLSVGLLVSSLPSSQPHTHSISDSSLALGSALQSALLCESILCSVFFTPGGREGRNGRILRMDFIVMLVLTLSKTRHLERTCFLGLSGPSPICMNRGAFQEIRLPHIHTKRECQIREANEMGILMAEFHCEMPVHGRNLLPPEQ